MNILKSVALAAGLSVSTLGLSASAFAAAPATDVSLATFWSQISSNWWNYVGSYTGGYTDSTSTTGTSGRLVTVISSVISWTLNITASGFDYAAAGNETLTSTIGYTLDGNAVDLDPGLGVSTTKTLASAPGYTVAATYSVPGPVAAAGLPVLALLGGFAWLRRRQSALAA